MAISFVVLPRASADNRNLPDGSQHSDRLELYPVDQDAVCPAPLQPAPLLKQLAQLDPAPERVLLADLPCTAALAALHETGWQAERIGIRRFPQDAEAAQPAGLTWQEHLADLGLITVNEDERLRLAWARDGWAGLSALAVGRDRANAIADKPQDPPIPHDRAQKHRRELDDLILALVPSGAVDGLADQLQRPRKSKTAYGAGRGARNPCPADVDPSDYDQASARHGPVGVKPVLVLGHPDNAHNPAGAIDRLQLQVPRARRAWLCRLMDDSTLTAGIDLVLSTGRYRCRLDARRASDGNGNGIMDALISRLLCVLLVTGRPLRHYGCTFYLPLDLHLLDDEGQRRSDAPASLLSRIEQRDERSASRNDLPKVERHRIQTATDALTQLVGRIPTDTNHDLRCRLSDWTLEPKDEPEKLAEAQALLYFLPSLRNRIFDTQAPDTGEAGIRHWRLDPGCLSGWRLCVEDPLWNPQTPVPKKIAAAVEDVSLFADPTDLMVLAVRVGLPPEQQHAAEPLADSGNAWWHPLVDHSQPFKDIAKLQTERWLWLTKAARLVRPAFPQQVIEGKIAPIVLEGADGCQTRFNLDDAFSPLVLRLLSCLGGAALQADSPRLQQVRDDRMLVNVAYGLSGPAPDGDPDAQQAFERLFSLALYVDRGSDGFAGQGGHAYDQAFVAERLRADASRRWADIGTLSGCSGYSNCLMGFGDYVCGPVARVHVPYIYGRMLLLALFYELTLRYFDRRITDRSTALQETNPKDHPDFLDQTAAINRLHRDFIAFTNDRWFRELTTQTQGAELFAQQTRALDLDAAYLLVKDKLERTDAFIEQVRGRRMSERGVELANEANRIATAAKQLSKVGLWFTRLAVWVAIVAAGITLVLAVPDGADRSLGGLPGTLGNLCNGSAWLYIDWRFVLAALMALVASGAALVGYGRMRKKQTPAERTSHNRQGATND